MKVGLIRVDGKFPNLALMKLSSFHKNQGDEVFLIDLSDMRLDRVYASQVFAGGTGFDMKGKLPDEIEHLMPDYDLFKTDFSIGFTSRGCIRDCKFCIVREKEGHIREHAWFEEFLAHEKVIIMDSNFLASPLWRKKLEFLAARKVKVNFSQGIDLRLVDEEKARLLSNVKYYDWKFRRRRIHVAWDNVKDEKVIFKGLEILSMYVPKKHIMCYVLVGFNTSLKQDIYRILKLLKFGIAPFIMIYNNNPNGELHRLARWINRRYYKVVDWKDFQRNGVVASPLTGKGGA